MIVLIYLEDNTSYIFNVIFTPILGEGGAGKFWFWFFLFVFPSQKKTRL